ncbi:recombination protein NinB [Rhizobium sp. RCAM05973]|uniref:recombination protein NinB n=1 Tax=Rhizobium sp. RCAM05973 TaxID=2994066 RepID=UPI0022EBD971|nr:recombination protein NinB [Rhizobium sp. RCAM05973]
MGRALLVLETDFDRHKAIDWIGRAPIGTRVEFKASKRSLPQNDRLWAMLTDVQAHMKPLGQDFTTDQWKCIFMHACGKEVAFLPSLDRKTFVPYGQSSSDLSKQEMTDLIEFIMAWASEQGVILHDPKQDIESGPSAPEEPVPAEDGAPTVSAASDGDAPLPSSDAPSSADLGWLRNVVRMLWAATNYRGDIGVLKAQKVAALASHPKPDGCPESVTRKAEASYGYCRQIVLGELGKADGLAMVAGVVGCDQHEIGRA